MALDWTQPPALDWTPPAPGIIRVGDVWKLSLDESLLRAGFPRNVRRAVVAELERLAKWGPKAGFRGEIDDLSKWAGADVAKVLRRELRDGQRYYAMPLLGTFAAASARGFRQNAAVVPAVATFITSYSNSGANATFNASNIGTASADRLVVVAFISYDNQSASATFSSATIDGGAATVVRTMTGTSAGNPFIGMFSRVVATGTSVNIVGTATGASNGVVLLIWTITGLLSTTATDHNSAIAGGAGGTNSSPMSTTANANNGGVALVVGGALTNALNAWTAGATASGSNTAQTTKAYAATASSLSAETPRTFTYSVTGSGRNAILVATFA